MNILVFTNIYPLKGTKTGFTPVVNYFCESWVNLGHNVLVVNSTSKFPFFYYLLPKKVEQYLESRLGFNLPNKFISRKIFVNQNGVMIYQLPIFKVLPGSIYSDKNIEKHYIEVINKLREINFIPDIALGHWTNPQIKLLSLLKKNHNIKTSLVIHGDLNKLELDLFIDNFDNIDHIGFRNLSILKDTENKIKFDFKNKVFICYSGVKFFFKPILKQGMKQKMEFNNSIVNISFVGNLIKRKYPLEIIKALNFINIKFFNVDYVGIGNQIDIIKKFKHNNNIKINLHGRISRLEVYKILEKSQIFIMISENETFGLVYLEAMLNGCIVVASRNGGFDGIIKNDINGFLCEAGNYLELKKIIEHILDLNYNDRLKIQENAFNTALKMSDNEMAKKYLNSLQTNYENQK